MSWRLSLSTSGGSLMRTPCCHFPCFHKLLAQLALSSQAAVEKGRGRVSLLPVPTSLWLWRQTGSSRTSSQGHFPAPSCPAHRRCRVDIHSLSLAPPLSLFILATPPSWRTGLPSVFKSCHTRCHDGRSLSCGGTPPTGCSLEGTARHTSV